MLYPKSSCSRSGSSAATVRGTARRCVSCGRSHARHVLEDDPEAGLVGRVRASTVEDLAAVEDDRARGHHRVDDLVSRFGPAVDPAMAARHDARRAVLDGEVVERPHRVHDDVGEVAGQRVDAGVVVEHLRLLAGADLDAGGRRQLVVPEHAVEDAEQQRVDRRVVEGACLREERVHPARVVALEVVAPERDLVEHLPKEAFAFETSAGDSIPSTMQ